jgi:hypothetical protein
VAISQSIFSNKLIEGVQANVPGVDPSTFINTGATSLSDVLTPDQLTQVLQILMNGLRDAFILPIAFAGLGLFLALMLTKDMRTPGGMKRPSP